MVIKTYIDKSNTIVANSLVNTGLNPITELFYGGSQGVEKYSRFIFYFDEKKIKELYENKTFADITKLKHTLKLTNTGAFDKDLLNQNMQTKKRASSFDLILFKINEEWDNGVGYDYEVPILANGSFNYSTNPSNWTSPRTGLFWSEGNGVFSGTSQHIIGSQSFDLGNENISIDITDYVNSILLGNETNYGLGLAFDRGYELLNTGNLQYVGFFTNNTQTFFEPYVETIYLNHIRDDRNDFYLDKYNKLYLYTNVAGNPINLDELPTVKIIDYNGDVFSGETETIVEQITKGVYCTEIMIPYNGNNIETMYYDVWDNIKINGLNRPAVELDFVVKDSNKYFNIGGNDFLPKKVAVSISGIRNNENIKRGEVRKVIVSARIPFTVEQTQLIDKIKYRLYVKEGKGELTVIDFQDIEMTTNNYYFLLDSESLLPNTYYLDVMVESNLEITKIKEVCKFNIINQVEY